ncbi:zinc metalloproteinase nas-14-like [Topomyia yanbarensis]|uniref:zinc metalloproteinase nas-14-like n=1 Tax=Topomyia yanbarensis TaxID=2498891 RepID=UPI00273BCDBC|nr:zinc metalloproteinase nas-14-like [Topomyia yanbarensis]
MRYLALICFLFVSSDSLPTRSKYDYNCETRTGNYEGDLLLTERQVDTIKAGREPLITEVDKWINNLVPYVMDAEFLSLEHAQLIRDAMAEIEELSSIRFITRSHEHAYLVVSGESTGCWSTLGRNRGLNRMNLSPTECFRKGTIVHQLLHVLGFVHETNSLDRDFYVDINLDHVRPKHKNDLQVYGGASVPDYGIPFDVDSIMNFGPTHFARDGLDTIIVKNDNRTLGQREKLSVKDIRKLNMMYNCGWC